MTTKYLLLLILLFHLPFILTAAITHDCSSTAQAIEKKNLNWNHFTSTGIDRILVVGITNNAGESVSSVTYNNVNLIEGDNIVQNLMRTSIWYLIAPDEGTHKIKVTLSGKADIFAGSDSYMGVDQSFPWGGFVTTSGKSTNASVTVNSADGQLVIDVIGLIAADPNNHPGQCLQHKIGGTLYNASSSKSGASSVVMSWTHSEEDWGLIAAPLIPANLLPVDLLYFAANVHEQTQVALDWTTASETNNDFFTIERSKDGMNWEKVKEVDSMGNGNAAFQYKEYDTNPYWGQSYYRLKQTDMDGSSQYFQTISIDLVKPSSEIVAYPNPVAQGNEINIARANASK